MRVVSALASEKFGFHARVLFVFHIYLLYGGVKLTPPESTDSTFPFNIISIPMALSHFSTPSS